MTLMKCPRCDLNYITPDQKYCKVCLREMKGEGKTEEVELCSICNEAPALPGKDVCLFCLKEMNKSNNSGDSEEDRGQDGGVDASNIGDIRTLVIHPASTLYFRSSREEKEAAGVFDDMIRVSVGIEDREDLIGDFICAIRESKE